MKILLVLMVSSVMFAHTPVGFNPPLPPAPFPPLTPLTRTQDQSVLCLNQKLKNKWVFCFNHQPPSFTCHRKQGRNLKNIFEEGQKESLLWILFPSSWFSLPILPLLFYSFQWVLITSPQAPSPPKNRQIDNLQHLKLILQVWLMEVLDIRNRNFVVCIMQKIYICYNHNWVVTPVAKSLWGSLCYIIQVIIKFQRVFRGALLS